MTQKYKTTVDAIQAVNYGMDEIIITGKPIIIPYHTSNISGIPSFTREKYFISVQAKNLSYVIRTNSFTKIKNVPTQY